MRVFRKMLKSCSTYIKRVVLLILSALHVYGSRAAESFSKTQSPKYDRPIVQRSADVLDIGNYIEWHAVIKL